MMKKIHVLDYSIILLVSVGKNAASIQGRLLFFVFTKFVWLLIKGGFYSGVASIQENMVSRSIFVWKSTWERTPFGNCSCLPRVF